MGINNFIYGNQNDKPKMGNEINYKTIIFLIVILGVVYFLFLESKKTDVIEKLKLEPNETYLMESGKCQNANLYYENGNIEVAAVDETGKIFALQEGKVRILSRDLDNKICIIYDITIEKNEISEPIKEISVSEIETTESIEIKKNEIKDILYTIKPLEATEKIVFMSHDENIAVVTSNGKIKGVKEGNTIVSITTESGFISKIIDVKVTDNNDFVNNDNQVANNKQSIKIIDSSINLNIQGNYDINYSIENIEEKDLVWETNNSKVATVNDGKITGISKGTAIITVRYLDKVSSSITVYVKDKNEITNVNLSEKIVNIKNGDTFKASAIVTPNTAENKTLLWNSNNNAIVTVDNNGLIKGLKVGTAIITVKTSNGKTDTMIVNVVNQEVEATEIKLNNSNLNLYVGNTGTLIYSLMPSNAVNKGVVWSSSNPNIATVDSSGKVVGISPGTTTITVKTNNGKTATTSVKVNPILATSVSLNKTSIILKKGTNITLVATISSVNTSDKTVTWISSNTSVATVDGNGKIVGIETGTATITVKTSNGKTATVKVTVEPYINPTELTLSRTSAELTVGKVIRLIATIKPSNATDKTITWSSSNPDIVTVTNEGYIRAKKAGTATITAKTSNNKIVKCTVKVTNSYKIHFLKATDENGNAHGDIVLIESNGQYGLIDAGSAHDYNKIYAYLIDLGVKQLDFYLNTHLHPDHVGAYNKIFPDFKPKTVFIKTYSGKEAGPNGFSDPVPSLEWQGRLIASAQNNGAIVVRVENYKDGENYTYLENTKIVFYNIVNRLTPNSSYYGKTDENVNSIIQYIQINGRKAMLYADLDYPELIKQYGTIVGKVDLVKLPHHGLTEAANIAVGDYNKPLYAVATIKNWGLPVGGVSKYTIGNKIYYTGDYNIIIFDFSSSTIKVETK